MISDAERTGLASRYGDIRLNPQPDGTVVLVLEEVLLPGGWNQDRTRVAFVLPIAYPSAQPDCFFANRTLRLASGALPQNAGIQTLSGEAWLWFSWHVGAWVPGRDDTRTYARFIESRLSHAQ